MASFTRVLLSGSTNGTPIAVTSTDSDGAVTVHTTSTAVDEIYLFGFNRSTLAGRIWVEMGDTVSPIVQTLSAESGLVPLVPGAPLTNSKIVRAYGSTVSTSALSVVGWVNRITG